MLMIGFILLLMLPTPAIWFLLDRKRRSRKRSWKKMETFWFSRLRFRRSYDSAYDSDSDSVAGEDPAIRPSKELYLQAVSDPRLYEACYVHTNWSEGSNMESQKKMLLLNTSYLSMAFYWTYESPDESFSSFLYSASREKSSGIVQNKTKRVTKDSSDLSFLFCFYPDPLVSWEHSCRNQRGGQICNIFLVNN